MITSIRIGQEFGGLDPRKYEGNRVDIFFYETLAKYCYPVPSLPTGLELNTSSNLVTIIGDNGAGKSTLLLNLFQQLQQRYFRAIPKPDYLSYEGEIDTPSLLERTEAGKDKRLQKLSDGERRATMLYEYLDEIKDRPKSWAILIDQPENDISLRRRKDLVRRITEAAFMPNRQFFIATHEPGFLYVPGSVIINLDESPATSTPQERFDVDKYLS